jgi:hypothetical protein
VFATWSYTPLAPIVIGAAWIAVFIVLEVRNRRAARRGERLVLWVELVPYVVALVLVQLLLDLHVRWLGDIVSIAVHVVVFAFVWLRRRRA